MATAGLVSSFAEHVRSCFRRTEPDAGSAPAATRTPFGLVAPTGAAGSHAGARHRWHDIGSEGALATAFAFAALVCWLLTKDHDILLRGAVSSERKHPRPSSDDAARALRCALELRLAL